MYASSNRETWTFSLLDKDTFAWVSTEIRRDDQWL